MKANLNVSIFLWTLILISLSLGQTTSYNQQIVHTQIDTCDDPDANIDCCFINMPAALTSTMTITNQEETGDKLTISGTISEQMVRHLIRMLLFTLIIQTAKVIIQKTGTKREFKNGMGACMVGVSQTVTDIIKFRPLDLLVILTIQCLHIFTLQLRQTEDKCIGLQTSFSVMTTWLIKNIYRHLSILGRLE